MQEVNFVLSQRAHSCIIQQTLLYTYHGARHLQRVQKHTKRRPALCGSWCWEWGIFTESLIKVRTTVVFEKYSTSPDLASFLCRFFLGCTVFNLGDWGSQHSEKKEFERGERKWDIKENQALPSCPCVCKCSRHSAGRGGGEKAELSLEAELQLAHITESHNPGHIGSRTNEVHFGRIVRNSGHFDFSIWHANFQYPTTILFTLRNTVDPWTMRVWIAQVPLDEDIFQ